jgi:hypothetical protein
MSPGFVMPIVIVCEQMSAFDTVALVALDGDCPYCRRPVAEHDFEVLDVADSRGGEAPVMPRGEGTP